MLSKKHRQEIKINLYVILRSTGERTQLLAEKLIKHQNIILAGFEVQNITPFEENLRMNYKTALQQNAEWTLVVDADVLLYPDSISRLLIEAQRYKNKKVISFQGLVFDKIFNRFRRAGHRMYQTRYLNVALNFIPNPGDSLRPETHVLQEMDKIGYKNKFVKVVFGVHDFNQYYKDLLKKSYLHGVKHKIEVVRDIEQFLKSCHLDQERKIILQGVLLGLQNNEKIFIDTKFFDEKLNKFSDKDFLSEKKPISEKKIEAFIDNFPNFIDNLKMTYPEPKRLVSVEMQNLVNTLGVYQAVMSTLYRWLERIGHILEKKSTY